MPRRPEPRSLSPSANELSYTFRVVGGAQSDWRDLYHVLLRMPWWQAFALICGVYFLLNAIFAGLYLLTGGIANAERGSFEDAYFFSVQTMGTIGYGNMYPQTHAANAVVVVQSVVSLVMTALATGLVFVRFSRIRGRIIVSKNAVISPMDGVPTLQIRVGNGRSNRIYDADFRVTYSRTTHTKEGALIYRSDDLRLVRDRAPTLMQSWTVMHRIDASSPLWRETPESLAAMDAEFSVAISGTDDTALQVIHGRHTFEHFDVVWGARLADVLTESPDGKVVTLDLTHFHGIVATQPTDEFPYPRTRNEGT